MSRLGPGTGMIFWLLACTLVAIIVIFTLLPMMRAEQDVDSLAFARNFYRDRQTALEEQLAAGEIDQASFDAAVAEQGRRLLAIAKTKDGAASGRAAVTRRKFAALIMLVAVPLCGIGLYLKMGRPGMPDVPLASRQVAPKDFDIATAIERIEAHLAKNPDDVRGYEVVAPVYMKSGRFDDAAKAWRRVIDLAGETSQRQADLAEALVASGNGVINAEARKAFEAALKLEPGMPRARYYLALASEQDGKKDEAIQGLEKLMAELPESPAKARIGAEIGRIKGIPSGDAADAIAAMPDKERAQAISGMVDSLETRLFSAGGDAGEWQKLLRAQLVLGQKDRAKASLERARRDLMEKPDGAAAIAALEALVSATP